MCPNIRYDIFGRKILGSKHNLTLLQQLQTFLEKKGNLRRVTSKGYSVALSCNLNNMDWPLRAGNSVVKLASSVNCIYGCVWGL